MKRACPFWSEMPGWGAFNEVLETCAEKNPNKLTDPSRVSFFVHSHGVFYPVIGISINRANPNWYSAVFYINTFVYCKNPIGVISSFNGFELQKKIGTMFKDVDGRVVSWYCPAIGPAEHEFRGTGYIDSLECKFAEYGIVLLDYDKLR